MLRRLGTVPTTGKPSFSLAGIGSSTRTDPDSKEAKAERSNIHSRNALLGVTVATCVCLIWLIHAAEQFNQRRMNRLGPSNQHTSLQVNVIPMEERKEEEVVDASAKYPRAPVYANAVKRTKTDTGVDVSDPSLLGTVDLMGDSSTATVMGLASGYDLKTYMGFVGGLRKAGFKGHIILGVAPDVAPEVLKYFKYRNVTPKVLKWVNCTYSQDSNEHDIFKKTTCSHPYSDIKIRWSRFPLQRDWLRDCATCTGPVLISDVRDTLFQLDPFGPGSPAVTGLQVFEEDKSQSTQHWLTKWPISKCKHVTYHETMLCSGTTIGTREAMLKYLEIMYEEMKVWIETPECRFDINGDDQSIHNHLFYSGQIPFATAIPNRRGGIVNTIGVEASKLRKIHAETNMKRYNIEQGAAVDKDYDGATGKRWIGEKYNIVDDEGRFIEFDGTRSRVVHQWDRFGKPLLRWMRHSDLYDDPTPDIV